ncbi:MAG: methylmalonyl-CoA mutase family protein, partial [Pseudomonadales bacterium]
MSVDKRWAELAEKELRGKPLDELTWQSPEGIPIKPLYTEADLEEISHISSFPGLEPFVRGPRATMYTNRPWTIRQYA